VHGVRLLLVVCSRLRAVKTKNKKRNKNKQLVLFAFFVFFAFFVLFLYYFCIIFVRKRVLPSLLTFF